MALALAIVAAVPADACGHRSRYRPIRGHMDLTMIWTPSQVGDPGYDENSIFAWDGEISGGIEGRMLFWNLLIEPAGPNGDWTHFKEIWQIFDLTTGELLLQGKDEGYVTPDGYYFMTGKVTTTSDAYGRYLGHRVFMYGKVLSDGSIVTGPGTFILF